MVKKKGFWKKTGCILISASIILTGVTFFSSSVSDAGLNTDQTTYTFTTTDHVAKYTDNLHGNNNIATIVDTDNCGGEIEANAFNDCDGLGFVIIGGPVEIGSQAFLDCDSLESVSFGKINSMSQDSFKSCDLLANISVTDNSGRFTVYDNAFYDGTTLLYVPAGCSSLTVKDGTTNIAANAFDDSSVSYLKFEDATDMVANGFGQQDEWPKFNLPGYELTVYAHNGAGTEVERYFWDNVDQDYKTRCHLQFDNASPTPTQKWTITLKGKLLDKTGNQVAEVDIGTLTVSNGATPSYTNATTTYPYGGIVYALDETKLPTFAAATKDETYYYEYNATDQQVSDYIITHKFTFQNAAGTVVKDDYYYTETVNAGSLPTMPNSKITYNEVEYGYVSGPEPAYVAAADNATYTYVYKEGSSGEGGNGGNNGGNTASTYTVTVYDEFYKGDLNHMTSSKIRSVNKYNAGSNYSFSHASYNGYSAYGGRNQSGTVNSDIKVYFFYLENGTAGKATDKPAEKKSEINTKLTNKYVITEGANQTVAANGGPVKIVCNGELEKLTGILVDETKVDPSRYTVASGSTILTFTGGFMKLFATGDHVVRFEYVDGYAETGLKVVDGKTTTTVTYKVSSDGSISSGHTKDATPKTADGFDNRYLLCLAIFLLGAGAMMLGKQKKLEAILAGDRDEY